MMYEDYFEKGDEFNFEDEEEEEGGLGEGRELMRGSEGEEDDRDLGPSGMDLGKALRFCWGLGLDGFLWCLGYACLYTHHWFIKILSRGGFLTKLGTVGT